MRTKLSSLQLGICACLALAGSFPPIAYGQTLKQVTKFDLPGPGGKRFDYLTIDEDDHYLLSAHLAAGQTYVIDRGTNKVVATITDTRVPKEWNTSRNSRGSTPRTLTTAPSVWGTSSR